MIPGSGGNDSRFLITMRRHTPHRDERAFDLHDV